MSKPAVLNIPVVASIGDTLYLCTDDKSTMFSLTGYTIDAKATVLYRLSNSDGNYFAYDFEFTSEKPVML